MPILNFDSLDLVPDGLREYAKTIEGSDKVNVNVVPSAKIDEFRDNNIKLAKERDDLRGQYDPLKLIIGDNAEEFVKSLEELRTTQQRVKDGELKETRTIEEALHKRTEELRKDYDSRLQAEGKEKAAWRIKYDGLDTQYRRSLISSAIKDAAMETDSGVEPKAISDITMAALQVFRCDDHGRIIPFEGDVMIYGPDGASPMTTREWIAKLKEDKPFFFKPSSGGGSLGDTTKRVYGIDRTVVRKMTAGERLALANEAKVPRKA